MSILVGALTFGLVIWFIWILGLIVTGWKREDEKGTFRIFANGSLAAGILAILMSFLIVLHVLGEAILKLI